MKKKEESKIGIISMFYNSTNYGGILQSYALVRYLEINGYKAEQICYNLYSIYSLKKRMKIYIKKYLQIASDHRNIKIYRRINKRNKFVIRTANKLVPHSRKVYKEKNIKKCIKDYSLFITGSDQVWHGEWPAFFLNFVPDTKKKIAYAVSTGKSYLTKDQIEIIINYVQSFTAISVREVDTLEILETFLKEKQIEMALDPTLLLSANDWNIITASQRYKEKYLFCYFLGPNKKMRNLATEYAKIKNLKIVTIPHMQQRIEPNDIDFGDMQIYDCGPKDFLSYIKYADVVFTDSFHASVFSNIFQVQYYVFSRLESNGMDSRIRTLTNMLRSENHFIDNENNFNLEHILKIKDIDYKKEAIDLTEMKEKSCDFINRAIGASLGHRKEQ